MTLPALPSPRDESWRWSDLKALPQLADARPSGKGADPSPWFLNGGGPRLVFIDGVFNAGQSDPGTIAIGRTDARSGGHPLAALAGHDGWTLSLGKDHATAGPVEIVHVSTGGSNHLANVVMLEEDAQASIIETFVGHGWVNRLTDIRLGAEARLMRSVRLLGSGGFTSLTDRAVLGEGASLTTTLLGAGGADSRIDLALTLDGKNAYAETGGALLARDTQRHDVNVALRHAQPGGVSRQMWRMVAEDQSTASVAARVEVARDAQKTDAEQSLRGLLIQRSATINLKPELEIFADDVKCAHGATVGELSRDALFYMAARGIPPQEARAILTRAFIADALDRIGEDKPREAFQADADAWLGGAA